MMLSSLRIYFFTKQDLWHDLGNRIGSCVSRNTIISRNYTTYHTAQNVWFPGNNIGYYQPLRILHCHQRCFLKLNSLMVHHCDLLIEHYLSFQDIENSWPLCFPFLLVFSINTVVQHRSTVNEKILSPCTKGVRVFGSTKGIR